MVLILILVLVVLALILILLVHGLILFGHWWKTDYYIYVWVVYSETIGSNNKSRCVEWENYCHYLKSHTSIYVDMYFYLKLLLHWRSRLEINAVKLVWSVLFSPILTGFPKLGWLPSLMLGSRLKFATGIYHASRIADYSRIDQWGKTT